jgi:hypothetical protein
MSLQKPRFYRYEVAFPRWLRITPNRYGWRVIGMAVTVGRWAYCIKWANA